MNYLGLYIQLIYIRLQTMVEYRNAFLWGALAQAASYVAQFLLIWVLINQFHMIGNWEPYQVMFLYALNLCSYAIAGFFMYNLFASLPTMIRTGEFDDLLTKPLNPFLHLTCKNFNYGYFTHFFLSILIIIICFDNLHVKLTPFGVLFLGIVILSGGLIQGAAFLFISAPSFWLIDSNSMGFFLWDLSGFVRYPITIYPKVIQVVLTLIIPYAFISFYPAQYFLSKNDFSLFYPVFQYLSPIVGILLFWGAYKFWTYGISNYKSSGS